MPDHASRLTHASRKARFGGPLDLAAVAAGGAVGTVLRGLSLLLVGPDAGDIPWVTVAENLGGAYLLGFVTMVLFRRAPHATRLHLFLATGVLGSFTTFSALVVDVVHLAHAGAGAGAVLYLVVSIPGGVAAALLGLMTGRGMQARVEPC